MGRPLLTLALALCLASPASVVLADGAYIPPEYGTAESADQRAIVVDHGATQTLVLETAYEGDLSDFAWVIPLPSLIQSAGISTVSQGVFSALENQSAPRAWIGLGGSASGGCGGCGGGTQFGGSPGDGRSQLGVTVWDTLQVDGYEVAILSATQSGDLAQWLADGGYALPDDNAPTLQYYVNTGAYFVAVKVDPDQVAVAQTNGAVATGGLEPLCLTFPMGPDGLVFPLRISQASSMGETEVRLFVLSDHRVSTPNYPTAQIDASGYTGAEDFTAFYDVRFRNTLSDLGDRGFVVEYARPLPEWAVSADLRSLLGEGEFFLTRLRTYLQPEQMTEDVRLVRAPTDNEFEVDLYVAGPSRARYFGALAALLMAAVQSRRARSRRGRDGARLSALLGVLLLLV